MPKMAKDKNPIGCIVRSAGAADAVSIDVEYVSIAEQRYTRPSFAGFSSSLGRLLSGLFCSRGYSETLSHKTGLRTRVSRRRHERPFEACPFEPRLPR